MLQVSKWSKSVGRSGLWALVLLCYVSSVQAGVVAYWDFEEGSGPTTADQTPNGNTATLVGGSSFDADTPLMLTGSMHSMRFDGSTGYLTAPDSASLSVTGSLTLSAWIKLDSPNVGPNAEQIILDKDVNNAYRWGLRSVSPTGYYNPARVFLNDGSSLQSDINGGFAAGSAWKHVAVVVDCSTGVARHYQDGVQIGADTVLTGTGIADSAGPMRIGAFNPNNAFFDGVMDDVAIFDEALSQDQIVSLADGSKTPLNVVPPPSQVPASVQAGVVAYWDFEEGWGPTTADQTPNGNTATLVGGSSFDADTPLMLTGSTHSMRFDGSTGYLTAPDSASLSVTGSLTLSAWIKLDTPNVGPNAEQIILDKDVNNAYRWGLRSVNATGYYNPARVFLNDGISLQSDINGGFAAGSAWKHVAVVVDCATGVARHYQDGVQIGADTALTGTGIADSAGPMRIGAFNSNNAFFDGVMDDVAIFNEALSQDQIVSLADGSKTPLNVVPPPRQIPARIRGVTLKLLYATPAVINRCADYGVNFIVFNMGPDGGGNALVPAPTAADPLIPYKNLIALLRDQLLPVCKQRGIKAAVLIVPWGRSLDFFWVAEQAGVYYDHLSQFWDAFARIFKDDPTLVAYDIMGEPNYNPSQENVWQNILLPQSIKAIRKVDPRVWLIVEPGPWGMPGGFNTLTPIDDPYVMYSFHPYAPHGYLHQGIGHPGEPAYALGQSYPGLLQMFPASPRVMWDKAKLKQYMAPAHDFALQHNVRMLAGEWGVVRWAPGRENWTSDMISIFEEWNFDWCAFSLNGWNGWNPTFGPNDPGSLEPYGGNDNTPVLNVWKAGWALPQP